MTQTQSLDSKTCPLCGKPNGCCAREDGIGACWCNSTAFAPGALQRVPPELRNKVCICRACATQSAEAAPASG